jgi:subtilisin family serine protease
MLRTSSIFVVIALGALLLLVASGGDSTLSSSRSYLVVAAEGYAPHALVPALHTVGADTVRPIDFIDVYVVTSARADFTIAAARVPGVEGVAPNLRNVGVSGGNADFGLVQVGPTVSLSSLGDDEALYSYQWALEAIDAEGAWDEGAVGTDVRVAVLDTGIRYGHPDLSPNLNTTLSKTFVPGETSADVTELFMFPSGHGTHVAGIIAAADNAWGVIGVAPEAEIVAVQVLSPVDGYGSWSQIIDGITYAGKIKSDVINLSLGGYLNRRGGWDDNGTADPDDDVWLSAKEVAAVVNATKRAIAYARKRGAVVICSAGNDAIDADHAKDLIILPAGVPGALCISATGPLGWYDDPDTDLDLLAVYSNYGQSEIHFAAPGGNFDEDEPDFWWWDMVMSTIPGGWAWAAGTSMAAPHVSGVAALIIGENGGSMKPSAVEKVLKKTSDDLGKPGRDDAYGHGRVNAYEAVR